MPHELTLPGAASSVPVARRFVQTALTDLGQDELVWTAALLVSELVTNAALHARTDITVVVVAVAAGPVRLEVRDGSPRLPRGRSYGPDATTGRGLQLVAELAARWGVDPGAAGKTVWVELDQPPADAEDERAYEAVELFAVSDGEQAADRPAGADPRAWYAAA